MRSCLLGFLHLGCISCGSVYHNPLKLEDSLEYVVGRLVCAPPFPPSFNNALVVTIEQDVLSFA